MSLAKRFQFSLWRVLLVSTLLVGMTALAPNWLPAPMRPQAAMAQPAEKHAQASLIADTDAIVPGKPFKLGVHLKIDPGWHTYYKDPGEAGMPTRIAWNLPPGFTASDLLWEKPHKFNDAGIVTYGYADQTLIAAVIKPPPNLKTNQPVKISAKVSWLTCKELCLPGEETVELTMPVAGAASPRNQKDFQQVGFSGATSSVGSDSGFAGNILDADLKVEGMAESQMPLWAYLGPAFVGGFILNFMPCVLPCIAIKVLSFVKQAGEEPKQVFKLGLIFCAGIISSFLVLAGAVIAIQAAGQKIGWGFQFQFPLFLLVMSAVVLVFALSLFGLIHFQFSAGQQKLDKIAQKEGPIGTFGKGVLATTLSTPCSAPFLGTALGFAFAQPPLTILLIFLTIGLGMSSPYLVLTANPAWMRFLPKPGDWMERFKESMGFLLLATVVWLVWVLGQQVGVSAAMSAVGFLVCLSFAVWLIGRFTDLLSTGKRKATIFSLAGIVVAIGYGACLAPFPQLLSTSPAVSAEGTNGTPPVQPASHIEPAAGEINWQPFTVQTLNENLKQGKTVFVDFTADWCLTCKANEATVINTPPVRDKLQALNVVTLKADWTRQDPVISKLLRKFGRSGVPLYVVFPGTRPTQPMVLPEVITQQIVTDALQKAAGSLSHS